VSTRAGASLFPYLERVTDRDELLHRALLLVVGLVALVIALIG
jgi:hypothetical protein